MSWLYIWNLEKQKLKKRKEGKKERRKDMRKEGLNPTSAQISCWKLPGTDVASTLCWVRLADSDTGTVVWTPAGCRTETPAGAAAWLGADRLTWAESETKPGVEICDAAELTEETIVSSTVKVDADIGAWSWAKATGCSVFWACVGVWGAADPRAGGGVRTGALASNWTVVETEIEAGAGTGDAAAAGDSVSILLPHIGVCPVDKTGGAVSKCWTSIRVPRGAATWEMNKKKTSYLWEWAII